VTVALVALLLGVARPPAAYVRVGTARVPLAISSWCWGARCGAPIAASTRTARVHRGSTVRVVLAFEPTQVHVAVGGARQRTSSRRTSSQSDEVSWRASRSGGITINAVSKRGFVTYVGRLIVR
jgi:hypothetical protein